jgi:hypothetical protein
MEPPYSFVHIDIQACWPESDREYQAYAHKVTSRGLQARPSEPSQGRLLTMAALRNIDVSTNGVLQVCLLRMGLFQGCQDDEIRDLHATNPIKVFCCQNRPLLIEAFADALLAYEQDLYRITHGVQTLPETGKEVLEELAIALDVYQELYERRRLRNKPATLAQLNKAWKIRPCRAILRIISMA